VSKSGGLRGEQIDEWAATAFVLVREEVNWGDWLTGELWVGRQPCGYSYAGVVALGRLGFESVLYMCFWWAWAKILFLGFFWPILLYIAHIFRALDGKRGWGHLEHSAPRRGWKYAY
jgi:hypothetical protein